MSDYANLLTPADRQRLEAYLAERETATGTQMAIAIFPSLEGESLEDYSIRLAQQWRIGQKGLDNGVILVVFVRDRKVRFEVGYGLEPVITDAVAGGIIRDVIAPRFREGRYAAGLEEASRAVYARIQGQGTPGARPARGAESPAWPVVGFFVLLGVIVMMLLIELVHPGRRARRNAYTAGARGWNAPMVVLPPWWGMGGGRWRGRDDGPFSGGGFSGGGGTFGGGGASGEW